MGLRLHIPGSKRREMEQQYRSVPQRKQAHWEWWLTHHPSPTWVLVANALYMLDEHGALEVLQKMYLKGKPPQAHTCVCELNWELHVCVQVPLSCDTTTLPTVTYT